MCTVYDVDARSLDELDAVPIGKAWVSSFVRVEDAGAQECGVNVLGELLVSGDCVMTEYFRREDLNAAAFVERDGRRYYRTGDLVRRDGNGELHLHGRADRQIKHHGYRIELDEIESLMQAHPDVSVGAVLLDDVRDEIVGVVCVSADPDDTVKSLRRSLKSRLPGYAVPSRLLVMESLPLSPNNKIDRQQIQRHLAVMDPALPERGRQQ